MRRICAPALLMCVLGTCVAHAQAGPTAQTERVERSSLLAGLRRQERARIPTESLAALPLYDLDLRLADDLTSYELRETIVYTNNTNMPLDEIVLRLYGNHADTTPAVRLESGHCVERTCEVMWPRPSVLRLKPKTAWAPGERVSAELRVRGRLRVLDSRQTDLLSQGLESMGSLVSGEAKRDYGLLSFGDGIASLAHFYAVVANRKAQRWVSDEQKPFGDVGATETSLVHAQLHVPSGVTVATSGTIVHRVGDAGGDRIEVNAGPVRDFAIIASRAFQQQSRQLGDVTVRAFFLGPDADGGRRALDTAARALAIFEQRFGRYPYTELDVAEAVLIGGAGGCEFSGLVSVASMLYRPLPFDPALLAQLSGTDASPIGSLLEFTTAHEVAHQYWYGVVGSDAREHPFQDESLTQWSARLYFEDRFGRERAQSEADAQIAMNYRLMRMLGRADGAVDRPVDAFDSTLSYAGLVYGKGAYLYTALRSLVGDDAFFGALRDYVQLYQFQIAPHTALFEQLAKRSGRPRAVRSLVAHWLRQRHGDSDLRLGTHPPMLSGGLEIGTNSQQGAARGLSQSTPSSSAGPESTANVTQLQGLLQALLGSGAQSTATLEQMQGLLQGMLGDSTAELRHTLEPGQLRSMAQRLLQGGKLDPSALQSQGRPGKAGRLLLDPGQSPSNTPATSELQELQDMLHTETNHRGLR